MRRGRRFLALPRLEWPGREIGMRDSRPLGAGDEVGHASRGDDVHGLVVAEGEDRVEPPARVVVAVGSPSVELEEVVVVREEAFSCPRSRHRSPGCASECSKTMTGRCLFRVSVSPVRTRGSYPSTSILTAAMDVDSEFPYGRVAVTDGDFFGHGIVGLWLRMMDARAPEHLPTS